MLRSLISPAAIIRSYANERQLLKVSFSYEDIGNVLLTIVGQIFFLDMLTHDDESIHLTSRSDPLPIFLVRDTAVSEEKHVISMGRRICLNALQHFIKNMVGQEVRLLCKHHDPDIPSPTAR
ncbi:hypothetical protein D3C73_1116240 [compost metagenome]